MIPVPAHAQALEAFTLNVNVLQGVVGAGIAEANNVVGLGIKAGVFNGLQFDWQPVGIPAWYIWCIITLEGLGLHDDVLQNFVHGMAEMDFAIGVWRAVMKHEFLMAGILLLNLAVNINIFPEIQNAWFILWQIATHRKICFWQI